MATAHLQFKQPYDDLMDWRGHTSILVIDYVTLVLNDGELHILQVTLKNSEKHANQRVVRLGWAIDLSWDVEFLTNQRVVRLGWAMYARLWIEGH